jgi:hypothetical protein
VTQVTLRCGRCGREAGPEMLGCPERPVGLCPYEQRQQTAARRKGSLGCLALAAAIASIAALTVGLTGGWLWAVVVELLLAAVVMGWLLARQQVLFDPATGAIWRRVAVLGGEVSRTVIPRLERLDLSLTPYEPLTLPASVAALTTESASPLTDALHAAARAGWEKRVADLPTPPSRDGVTLFTAALAGLLAANAVEVRSGRLLKRRFKLRTMGMVDEEEPVYLFSPGAGAEAACGALEERIVERLLTWEANPRALDWPLGPPVYELVYALFDGNKTMPGKWLASLAVDEASERGLGRMVKGSGENADRRPPQGVMERAVRLVERMAGHFEVDPSAERLMDDQRQIVLDLVEQLEVADRDFMGYLRAEARRAFEAREESSD